MLVGIVGLRLECVMVDVLHTVDQGIASHIIANICWLLAVVRGVFGGSTQQEKIKNLYKHMNDWHKNNKTCKSKLQGTLTVERIRTSGGWPKLKAKAAQTRHLSKYAFHLICTFGTTSDYDRKVTAVCQLLVRFYEMLDNEAKFLGAAAREEISKLGFRMGVLYSDLGKQAQVAKEKMWKLSPKLHIFVHMCEWQAVEWGNPRFWWTYADEDLVGIMIEIAESVHPSTMAISCLFKWLHIAFDVE